MHTGMTDARKASPMSKHACVAQLTELKNGERGVSIGEENLFLNVEYKEPTWRFRLIDLHGGHHPRTAWIKAKDPGDLRSSFKAKILRSILKTEYKDKGSQVLELVIGVVQDHEQKWKPPNEETEAEETYNEDVTSKANEIIEKGDIFQFINDEAAKIHAGDRDLIRLEWVSALSGPLSFIPINTWVIGRSGKGKSHAKYTIIQLLPKELYQVFTSASPLSLFYFIKHKGKTALDGIVLYIDEVEASKYAIPMLRTLTSQTKILPRHLSVHEAEVLDLKILGKRTVWFTSIKTFGSEQIKNRFIHANPDETIEQDDRVFDLQDRMYRRGEPQHNFHVAKALAHTIVEDTKDLKVTIPYRIDWPFKERRHLYPIFLSFIQVTCKIHYKRRKRDQEDRLVASEEDFNRAKDLWHTFEETIVKRVSGSALTVLEHIQGEPTLAKTHAELSREIPLSTRQISNLCDQLQDEGLVNAQKRGTEKGRPAWEYWRAAQPTVANIEMIYGNSEMPVESSSCPSNNVEKRPTTLFESRFQNSKNPKVLD